MILVTGAAGLSGSAVVREFARQGAPVRALVRSRARARALEAFPTVEIVEGDLARPETLRAALDGVDRALLISTADPQMVETQCAFIDTAKRAGVRHVVKFSGRGASTDSRFRFVRMHAEIERHLERAGLAWTHLRPGQFMPVYFREVRTIVAHDTIALPLADARLAPVDMDDIARVAFALLSGAGHEGRVYEMTGPEALTMTEIAAHISRAIGRTLRYVDVTPAEARRAWLAAGMPPAFVDALDELFGERRRGVESRVCLDAHEAFGIRPTTFAEFALRNAAVFRGATP
jgi:uncharacterized protein YbjT (DUF2867 family)